jgi:ubiquinone/menaquinone biosynthesis C-methylase UbiE
VSGAYALGDSESELARLIEQGRVIGDLTREALVEAGLTRGMSVLDLGCGPGDVSFLAAQIVGAEGSVLGVDRSGPALDLARQRADAIGLPNVRFAGADVAAGDFGTDGRFDAVVSRFLLLYLPDPAATLRTAARLVRPGGFVLAQESIMSLARTFPELPLAGTVTGWLLAAFRAAGADPDVGARLHRLFADAGLAEPRLPVGGRLVTASDAAEHRYVVDVVGSLQPVLEAAGIASAAEIDLPTLSARLRDELAAADGVVVLPPVVACWARV